MTVPLTMKLHRRFPWLRWVLVAVAARVGWGASVTEWRHWQELPVPQTGLFKVSLPATTLGAARSGLEDLRLIAPNGREVPFAVERSRPVARVERAPRSLGSTLGPSNTVVLIETGVDGAIETVTLQSSGTGFVKAVTIEASADRRTWQVVAQGLPIFRQPSGASQLDLPLPPARYAWLRLTVDDRRTGPVPFTGASLHLVEDRAPTEVTVLPIVERREEGPRTRWVGTLPGANLTLAGIELDTPEPVFTRDVTVATRRRTDGQTQETQLGRGTVYRLALSEGLVRSNLHVPLEATAVSRELVLTLDNQDSPPLALTRVLAEWRPLYLVFYAAEPGAYRVLTGNNLCPAPRYDLAALGPDLTKIPVSTLTLSPLGFNPEFREAAAVPAAAGPGAALDTAAWKYRRPVLIARTGVQRAELDLPVLARAQSDLRDLRVLQGTNQLPYLTERLAVPRTLAPSAASNPDPKHPSVSRWKLTLPYRNLPITRLACASATPLFRREVTLWEEPSNERGERYRRQLASAVWSRTPTSTLDTFALDLAGQPETEVLWLETDNGDNPPVVFERFECAYPASRLLFPVERIGEVWLYYGNPGSAAPRYDMELIAGRLLAAEKVEAGLGPEETLHKASWSEQFGQGEAGGPLFWGVLILVVGGLFFVIVRLLPSPAPAKPPGPEGSG